MPNTNDLKEEWRDYNKTANDFSVDGIADWWLSKLSSLQDRAKEEGFVIAQIVKQADFEQTQLLSLKMKRNMGLSNNCPESWEDTFRHFYDDNETGGSSRWLVTPTSVKIFIAGQIAKAEKKGEEKEKTRFASDYLFLHFIDPYVNKKVADTTSSIIELGQKLIDKYVFDSMTGKNKKMLPYDKGIMDLITKITNLHDPSKSNL